jgi:hypothetical protein
MSREGKPFEEAVAGTFLIAASIGLIVWLSGVAGIAMTLVVMLMLWVGLFLTFC